MENGKMYISLLKLWNFRKYGSDNFDLKKPNLTVPFQSGLNVLIGENDSGKTAILDAIKLVLKTHAYEWIKMEKEDFHKGQEKLRIELEFSGISDNEARHFIEWLGTAEEEIEKEERKTKEVRPKLILIYQVEKKGNKILPSEVKAGMDGVGHQLTAEARDYLKCTYLKALRDADSDLTAKKNSRLSQILQEHSLFKKKKEDEIHEFEGEFKKLNDYIIDKFVNANSDYYSKIKREVDQFLNNFINENYLSAFSFGEPEIKNILEKLTLGIEEVSNLGLGTMNRLYMAAELLHLKREWDGLKLCMIEELEAHLHPQAQIKVIETLLQEKEIQFILTTHSPNIASKVPLKSLIICKDNIIFPLGDGNTKLENKNYSYLETFLDVTKSNLFFAKGIIIVEGWSEAILIPAIGKKLGYDLIKKEISIINVGSTAYLHFAKIFLRKDGSKMNIPVAIVTDLDNRPNENGIFKSIKEESERVKTKQQSLEDLKEALKDSSVKLELAKEWTFEWCLFKSKSLSNLFKESVATVHSGTNEFQKKSNGTFEDEFQKKLISKLKKEEGTSPLDKVKIASELADRIEKTQSLTIESNDEYLQYIINSVKHVCDYDPNKI